MPLGIVVFFDFLELKQASSMRSFAKVAESVKVVEGVRVVKRYPQLAGWWRWTFLFLNLIICGHWRRWWRVKGGGG